MKSGSGLGTRLHYISICTKYNYLLETSHKTSNGILEIKTYRIWFNVRKHLWPATNDIASCFLPCFPCTEIVELDVDNSYELLRDTKMGIQ